ncbi:unnamed protein product [Didymodactylos carnosus]|uniref:Transcription factor BYE1 n=1 Tax=Didymodactylos carnosus TaxID=1234261 RepID=A0A813WN90_9BILA|nr:unnamed protein product [Didymodactylos carnosus]CAF0856130.1 unnamed protein product [Didymodactylos carnosus]CAF3545138.1 unnamed protein product [Didymodactylos carnosus]CAF3643894.1 unnamed protein product [Didymodactylos carnosus]
MTDTNLFDTVIPSPDQTRALGTNYSTASSDSFQHGSRASDDGSNYSHEDERDLIFKSRKSYPTRTSRPKINYRDIERGIYGDIRNSLWNIPTERATSNGLTKRKALHQHDSDDLMKERREQAPESKDNNSNKDLPQLHNRAYASPPTLQRKNSEQDDEDEEEQQTEDTNTNRRLWCICKQVWDVNRFMIRCDNCSDWFHGDCVGITKNQAIELDMNDDQFICPICKDQQRVQTKQMAEQSNLNTIKRKRTETQAGITISSINISSGDVSEHKEQIKRQKTTVKRDNLMFNNINDKKIHCILRGCDNWSKLGWVYCSIQCIRKHINDTLRAIQSAKGSDKLTRDDIMLYEQKTDTILNSSSVPLPVDVCDWIIRHPSFQIIHPELKKATYIHRKLGIPKIHPTVSSTKLSTFTNVNNIKSYEINDKKPLSVIEKQEAAKKVQLSTSSINKSSSQKQQQQRQDSKEKSKTKTSTVASKESQSSLSKNNQMDPATIRTKVRNSLNEYLLERTQKANLTQYTSDHIKNICIHIEEEMYRIFGNTGDKYKQKFRTILFNIKDKNNDIFQKIVSKELNAKQLVQMNADDMAPDDVKEQRRLEILKEAEAIKKYNAETAVELAKRSKSKVTRQGLIELEATEHSKNDNQQLPSDDSEIIEKASVAKPVNDTSASLSSTKMLLIKPKPNILTAVSKTSTNNEKPLSKTKPTSNKRPIVETTLSQQNASTISAHSDAFILAKHRSHVFDKNCQICNSNMTVDKHLIRQTRLESTPYSLTSSVEPQTVHEQIDITIPMKVNSNISHEAIFNKNKEQQNVTTTITATPISKDETEHTDCFYPTTIDGDNDYIEPESPTGDDAKLYDDDDWSDTIHQQQQQRPAYIPSSSISRTTITPEKSLNALSYHPYQSILDDYKPTNLDNIRKSDSSETSTYPRTSITRSNSIRWRGSIYLDSQKIYCQSNQLYGNADYLYTDIPDKITICGRLRTDDLYSYVEQSLSVRDILIMNLVSSDDSTKQLFDKYVDILRLANRAAVANKGTQKSIKDIYIIPVNHINVFPPIIRAVIVNSSNNSTQLPFSTGSDGGYLFMIIIASGKRTTAAVAVSDSVKKPVKALPQQIDHQVRTTTATVAQTANRTLTYKPVGLHDEMAVNVRDPRLRNKDPRIPDEPIQHKKDTPVITASSAINLSFSQSKAASDMNTVKSEATGIEEQQNNPPSLLKTELARSPHSDDIISQQIISESLNRVRQALTLPDQRAIIVETVELLKPTPFFCNKYLDELKNILADLQNMRTPPPFTAGFKINDKSASILPGDDHRTEDMDVEEDIEDKSNSTMEFNDVDYRFLTSVQSIEETLSPMIIESKKTDISETDQDHRQQSSAMNSHQQSNVVEEKSIIVQSKDQDHRQRKSRFSSLNSIIDDGVSQIAHHKSHDQQPSTTIKNSKLPFNLNDIFPSDDEDDETDNNVQGYSKLLLDDGHKTSQKTSSEESSSVKSTFSNKFRPVIEVHQNVIITNALDTEVTSPTVDSYKPIRFSISKVPMRQRNSSISQLSSTPITNDDKKKTEKSASFIIVKPSEDPYESAPQYIDDLIQQVQLYGFQGLSLQNSNWTKSLSSSSILTGSYLSYLYQNHHGQSSKPSVNQSSTHIFPFPNSTSNSPIKYFPRSRQKNIRNSMPRYRDFDRPEGAD